MTVFVARKATPSGRRYISDLLAIGMIDLLLVPFEDGAAVELLGSGHEVLDQCQ
jgi:hypothetical protein